MKTIKWYKVKCSFYDQCIGIKTWDEVIEFIKKHRCFDYTIMGQTRDIYCDVNFVYKDEEEEMAALLADNKLAELAEIDVEKTEVTEEIKLSFAERIGLNLFDVYEFEEGEEVEYEES